MELQLANFLFYDGNPDRGDIQACCLTTAVTPFSCSSRVPPVFPLNFLCPALMALRFSIAFAGSHAKFQFFVLVG
jgi:hypothetical protein